MRFFLLFLMCAFQCCFFKQPRVKTGDEVWISMILKTKSQLIEQKDLSDNKQVIRLKCGKRHVFKEVDISIEGMKKGEEKSVMILPQNAYGNVGVSYMNASCNLSSLIEPGDTLMALIKIEEIITR